MYVALDGCIRIKGEGYVVYNRQRKQDFSGIA